MTKKILIGVLAVFIILQFFQIDKSNPEYDASQDLITIHNPPAEVAGILKSACYDCHSYETAYPWYTNVQPLAWWIKDHIDEGRDEMNFSEWGTYSPRRADHKLEESVELVEGGEMPLESYTLAHGEAKLSEAQKKILTDWFKTQREVIYPDSLRSADS